MKAALLDTLKKGVRILEQKKFDDARISCEELLSHVTNKPRFRFYTDPKDRISERSQAKFFRLVRKRAKHEPLQYLIGNVQFRNAQIDVRKGTLIPRPETEQLVETALKKISKIGNTKLKILDVGTGSGCIAINLAKECPDAQIWATDISRRSLKLAAHNAEANGTQGRIKFIRANYWLKSFERMDLVVSNPPYLSEKDFESLQPELKFEPKRALYASRDGLSCYRFMIRHACDILKPNGLMIFEVGIGQAKKVAELFRKNYFDSIEITRDLAGIDRIVSATLRK